MTWVTGGPEGIGSLLRVVASVVRIPLLQVTAE